ncbi:2-keto-4-pentenoate hydratase [Rhizobium sp. CG5]|uniref:fumarylacetoacetate hydrolase family protein n=1 Tax=Rhizobium sp. CG5 TaxID=2726076 RepID=UPI002033D717|nr:fumarylacetoacetate hydrolase family protein [Rhizobium sp. CG5]MCM2476034.1 2-keto-4-pentenoate hydratase [Rhizobium sp. CG5]
MKLATLKDSTRDGKLVVVSKDLTRCSEVGHIARSLQAALDDWAHVGPRLARVAIGIETGSQPTLRFHEHDAASPLPRAFQRLEHSAGAVVQLASDSMVPPRSPIDIPADIAAVTSGVEVAVILGDVPMGATKAEALASIQLVMLANHLSVGGTALSPSYSPVAVSLDELGESWKDGALHLPFNLSINGKAVVAANAAVATGFADVIVEAARTRPLSAGTIVELASSGEGQSITVGDVIRISMKDPAGHSIFGAIEQTVAKAGAL